MLGMVSILTLGPLPERPLFCCCTFQTGMASVLSGPSETERQTTLPSLSLSRGEWESVIKINTVAGRLLFLQRQCFKEICFAIPMEPPSSSLSTRSGLHQKEDPESRLLAMSFFSPRFQTPEHSFGDWLEIKINTEKIEVSHRKTKKCMLGVGVGWVGISNISQRKVDSVHLQNRIDLSLSEIFWEHQVKFWRASFATSQRT